MKSLQCEINETQTSFPIDFDGKLNVAKKRKGGLIMTLHNRTKIF
jgi:hypothetical protein